MNFKLFHARHDDCLWVCDRWTRERVLAGRAGAWNAGAGEAGTGQSRRRRSARSHLGRGSAKTSMVRCNKWDWELQDRVEANDVGRCVDMKATSRVTLARYKPAKCTRRVRHGDRLVNWGRCLSTEYLGNKGTRAL
jgi:hypothetical protein